jgi:hypothetical protein
MGLSVADTVTGILPTWFERAALLTRHCVPFVALSGFVTRFRVPAVIAHALTGPFPLGGVPLGVVTGGVVLDKLVGSGAHGVTAHVAAERTLAGLPYERPTTPSGNGIAPGAPVPVLVTKLNSGRIVRIKVWERVFGGTAMSVADTLKLYAFAAAADVILRMH